MFLYFFLIVTLSTIVVDSQQISKNLTSEVSSVSKPPVDQVQSESKVQKGDGDNLKIPQNHRFQSNSTSEVYAQVLEKRKAQREFQKNGNVEETSKNLVEENSVLNFSKNKLLADTQPVTRPNFVEIIQSQTVDYNFTSIGNGTNYLTAFGLRKEGSEGSSKKNKTSLESSKDQFITDLEDPSTNDLIQKVEKKQVSQNHWNQGSNNTQRNQRGNQNFDRNQAPNEIGTGTTGNSWNQNRFQESRATRERNFGNGNQANLPGPGSSNFRESREQNFQNGSARENRPPNTAGTSRDSNRDSRDFRNGSGNQNPGQNGSGGNSQRNPVRNQNSSRGSESPRGSRDFDNNRNQETSTHRDSEPSGSFHSTNQVPQNNFGDDFNGFHEDRSNFGRAAPSNVYGSDFRPSGSGNFQPTTPGYQDFDRPFQTPQSEYGPGPIQTTFPPAPRFNSPSPGPSRPIGPPSSSYGSPDDNIPQSSPGNFQSSQGPDEDYPSFPVQPNQGPSNTYGSPNRPLAGNQGPSEENYPSFPTNPQQGSGYPSGRPQSQGYPSGRPQGPGFPSGRPQNQGYPSGRPSTPSQPLPNPNPSDGYQYPGPQRPSPSPSPSRPVPSPSRPVQPNPQVGPTSSGDGYRYPAPQGPSPRPSGPSDQSPAPSRGQPQIPAGKGPSGLSKVHKHIYFHVAPPFEEDYKKVPKGDIDLPAPEKHYKILFIKTPTVPPQTTVVTQNQNEEKTLVYVLVKKPEEGDINVVTPKPTPPSKPEVFFIRYKNKRDEGNSTGDEPQGYPEKGGPQPDVPGPSKSPGYDYPKPTQAPSSPTSPGYDYPKPTIESLLERKDLVSPTPIAPVPVISPVPILPQVHQIHQVPETIIQPQVHLPNYETYLTLNEFQKSYGSEGLNLEHTENHPVVFQPEVSHEVPYGTNTANLLLGQYENLVYV